MGGPKKFDLSKVGAKLRKAKAKRDRGIDSIRRHLYAAMEFYKAGVDCGEANAKRDMADVVCLLARMGQCPDLFDFEETCQRRLSRATPERDGGQTPGAHGRR